MFIERNKKNRTQIHDDFAKKNKDSVIRHEKNAISVRKLNKKLEKETEEREFQKYITYYFLKKGQNQSLSKKKKESNNKLQEKAEKLEEIEKQNEEKRKELVKKMKKMDNLREQYKKKKEEKIIEEKIRREEKTKNVKERLDEMDKFEIERRRSVLDYQSESMMRSMNMNVVNGKIEGHQLRKSRIHCRKTGFQLFVERKVQAGKQSSLSQGLLLAISPCVFRLHGDEGKHHGGAAPRQTTLTVFTCRAAAAVLHTTNTVAVGQINHTAVHSIFLNNGSHIISHRPCIF